MSNLSNKFVTQSEADETRRKRQEEWEKKRKPDDPLECPEEDKRSLYERLQEQKLKKDEEYDEQHKLKNSVKGLDEDEAQFLEFVSNKQMQIEKERSAEEKSIIKELKDSSVTSIQPSTSQEKKVTKTSLPSQPNKKSQTALLAGAVKRKGVGEGDDSKKRKTNEGNGTESEADKTAMDQIENQRMKVIGILPGLGAYDNDTSDSETSSSDSDGSEDESSLFNAKVLGARSAVEQMKSAG